MNIPKPIRNASIVGGIAAFSTLAANPTPSWRILYAAAIGFCLSWLIEYQHECNAPRRKKRTKLILSNNTFFF